MRFFTFAVLPALALGAAVVPASEDSADSALIEDTIVGGDNNNDLEFGGNDLEVGGNDDELAGNAGAPQLPVDEPDFLKDKPHQDCYDCEHCVDYSWTDCDTNGQKYFLFNFNDKCTKKIGGTISWVQACPLTLPTGATVTRGPSATVCNSGKCSDVALGEVIKIGPFSEGDSFTLQWHDGLIGDKDGSAVPCGNHGHPNNRCGWNICSKVYNFPGDCPNNTPDTECRKETATGQGIPMNQNGGGNWFMYCDLDENSCAGKIQASKDGTVIGDYTITYYPQTQLTDVWYRLDGPWQLVPNAKDNFKAGAWATAPSGNFPPGQNFACKRTMSTLEGIQGENTVSCGGFYDAKNKLAPGYAAIHFTVETNTC